MNNDETKYIMLHSDDIKATDQPDVRVALPLYGCQVVDGFTRIFVKSVDKPGYFGVVHVWEKPKELLEKAEEVGEFLFFVDEFLENGGIATSKQIRDVCHVNEK